MVLKSYTELMLVLYGPNALYCAIVQLSMLTASRYLKPSLSSCALRSCVFPRRSSVAGIKDAFTAMDSSCVGGSQEETANVEFCGVKIPSRYELRCITPKGKNI